MLYVYAIVADPPAILGRGLRRERLARVRVGRVFAIAGEMETVPTPDPGGLAAHDGVVRRLARRCPALLPARFGSSAATATALRAQLAPRAAELGEALRLVKGCVQMTVRVFGATPPPPARRRSAKTKGAPGAGTRYLLDRALEYREAQSLPEIEPLRLRLADVVRAEHVERQMRQGVIGTAYHLVERKRLATYRRRLRGGVASLSSMRVQVSGPWPPYAFAPKAQP